MNAKSVKSGKTGRRGWRYRYTDPARGGRTHKTIWITERRESDRAFKEFLDGREARKLGLPDNSGWQISYDEAVKRFLAEAPIPTPVRRDQLKFDLEHNLLKLRFLRELGSLGALSAKCHRLLDSQKDIYVIKNVQQPLKQLAAWCASTGLLPYNPLAAWKKIRRSSEAKRPRAFLPSEMQAILDAADEIDRCFRRSFSSSLVFKTLLVTGNRPTALFNAKVKDLHSHRIHLAPGNGTKRNGVATVPLAFEAELKRSIEERDAEPDNPLLLSPLGSAVCVDNINDDFKRAEILAFVRLSWPQDDPATLEISPMEVATSLFTGRRLKFDGAPPTDTKKIAQRARKIALLEELSARIKPEVDRLMERRPMYALRATHITWARNLPVNGDAVMAQVGHAPRDIEEKHYLDQDMVDPAESSQAVWDVLTGKRQLRGKLRNAGKLQVSEDKKLHSVDPVGDHNERSGKIAASKDLEKLAQLLEFLRIYKSGGYRDRTGDLQTASLTLSQLS